MFRSPAVVPGRMVGHPVEHHFHACPVGCLDECLEVGHGAVLAVDALVVAYAVGGADGIFLAGLLHGHHPEHVATHGGYILDLGGEGGQTVVVGEKTGVGLIDDLLRYLRPDCGGGRIRGHLHIVRLAGCESCRCKGYCKSLADISCFHFLLLIILAIAEPVSALKV